MNNKLITTNSATTINPWDESSKAKELFEEVKSGFENYKDLGEECFKIIDNMNFYLVCPTSVQATHGCYIPSHFAYSMIFGHFLIDDGIRKYKFYTDENTFVQILVNLYLFSPNNKYDREYFAENCDVASSMVEYRIVDHFKNEFNIKNVFYCKECTCRMDQDSFSTILDSNHGITDFSQEKFINCPICGSEIEIDENIKDKLRSYETLYNYHCFSKKQFGKEFQVKFMANLLYNNKESMFIKEFEFGEISDHLCQDLFSISKNELISFFHLFRIRIDNQIYDAVNKFIKYEDDPEHFKYLESHRSEALSYWRRKKLDRLAESQRI
jgi:hypothetical protein